MEVNYNYPEFILRELREYYDLDPDDTSKDRELHSYPPEFILSCLLEARNLGYLQHTIYKWIEGIYGIQLHPGRAVNLAISKGDFVRGFGNLFRAFPVGERMGVEAMEMSEREIVTVWFRGGHIAEANIGMDSRYAAMLDIINQAVK